VYIISFIKPFKIYLTNHNIWSIDKKYKWTGKLLAMIQSRLVKLLYVNENTPERYKAAGIKMCENSEKISPFLPPNIEDGKNIFEEYSFEIKSFVENKSPLLIANAHKIVFLEDTDLYGFDMCLASLEVLVSKYPNLGLIFAIGNVDEHSNYIQEKIERLKSKNLDDSFLLVFPQITIWPLIDEVDILLRPTCTDGSAISIDEALYLGTKVIASDVTSRQEGSILFKSRDQNDFENCILKVLNNAPSTN
ncbi:MAG: glycosyltransferase involved in cell wall biosynthesis, partial [Limisphaerales bacterium]